MLLSSPGVLLQAERRGGGYSSTVRLERLPVRQRLRGPDVHDLRLQQEGTTSAMPVVFVFCVCCILLYVMYVLHVL